MAGEHGLISASSFIYLFLEWRQIFSSHSRENIPLLSGGHSGELFCRRRQKKKKLLDVLERRELDTCKEIGVEEVRNAVNCAREPV